MPCVLPVSYTHIDVYKRQASAGAQSAQFCLGRRNSGYIEGKGHCPGRHARGRSIQASIGETTGLDEFFNTIREQEAPQNWKAQQCSPIASVSYTHLDVYKRQTAMNQQKFRFTLNGNQVSAKAGIGFYAKVDLGIVKYHFEVGAGKTGWEWSE